jgi:adenylate cyclase
MSAADRRELADYHAALGLYRNQEWYEAHEAFLELQRNTPHRVLYALYLERIAHFANEPPESQWDSTFTLLSK